MKKTRWRVMPPDMTRRPRGCSFRCVVTYLLPSSRSLKHVGRRLMSPKFKVLYYRTTMPHLTAADHLATRLNELLDHGCICRQAFLDNEQARVWVEPKPGDAFKRRPVSARTSSDNWPQ